MLSARKAPGSAGERRGFAGNARFGCVPKFAASSGEKEKGISRASARRAGSLVEKYWLFLVQIFTLAKLAGPTNEKL